MSAVLLTLPPTRWVCPNCPVEEVTPGNLPNRFHLCRGLAGITAPMVPAGSQSRVRAVEREDYVGQEIVQYDGNGRPVGAVITERPDGSNDVAVLAPTANLTAGVI
jgi:hypothetical protein